VNCGTKARPAARFSGWWNLRTDCDQDALIAKVDRPGSGCCSGAGARDCFYRRIAFGDEVETLGDAPVPLTPVLAADGA